MIAFVSVADYKSANDKEDIYTMRADGECVIGKQLEVVFKRLK